MHAIIRRYDGVNQESHQELTGKVNETLVPKLRKLAGFKGYYLIEAGDVSLAPSVSSRPVEQGEESGKLVNWWIHDEKLGR